MKRLMTATNTTTARVPIWGVIAAVALLAPANADGGPMEGDGGGDGTAGGPFLASEAIGSLPTYWVDDSVVLAPMDDPAETEYQLDLHVEGIVPADQVEDLVVDATGNGYVFLSYTDATELQVRMRFFGDVVVDFDREMVVQGGIPLQLEMGDKNAFGLGAISVDGALSPAFELAGLLGEVDVPLGSSPAFDAIFETSDVSLYTLSTAQDDIGRVDVDVTTGGNYRFQLEVVDSITL